MGTLGGALEARQIDAGKGRLTAEVTGEVESEDNVLIIRRIHVIYRIQADPGQRETIDRVHSIHARYCPVYRSLEAAIQITTDYTLEPAPAGS